jgi:hypothetical protein
VFYFHQVNGFGYPLRFIPVYGFRPACGYGTEAATTGTDIAKDHEGGGTGSPAFTHIGAITAFANGVEFVIVYQLADMFVILSNGQFHPQPVGFFDPGIISVRRRYRKLDHRANLRKKFQPYFQGHIPNFRLG